MATVAGIYSNYLWPYIIFLDVFKNISIVRNLSDILNPVYIVSNKPLQSVSKFEGVRFSPYYPGIRAELDLSQYLKNTNDLEIYFPFKKSEEYSTEIQLDDIFSNIWRPLIRNKMKHKGSSIIASKKEKRKYYIRIGQRIFDEKDETKNCRPYPNENFISYAECDASFTKTEYQRTLKLMNNYCEKPNKEIIPIFATNDLGTVHI